MPPSGGGSSSIPSRPNVLSPIEICPVNENFVERRVAVAGDGEGESFARHAQQLAVAHDDVRRAVGIPDVEVIAVDSGDGAGSLAHRADGFARRREGVVRQDRRDVDVGAM